MQSWRIPFPHEDLKLEIIESFQTSTGMVQVKLKGDYTHLTEFYQRWMKYFPEMPYDPWGRYKGDVLTVGHYGND